MARILILLGLAAALMGVVLAIRRGRWQWVGCCVLTAVVAAGVLVYSLLPTRDGLTLAKFVGFVGGPILAAAVSLIPGTCWFLVSRVYPQNTRVGRIYAVIYSVLMGMCFIPAGLVSAACYFPANARKVLGRLADSLPGNGDGNTKTSDN